MKEIISSSFTEHTKVVEYLKNQEDTIKKIASLFLFTLKNKGKIIFFGNGGSAADAQHLAAEFVGKFKKKRKPLAAVALNTNTSILTAVGNDFGFENVFAIQIEAIGNPHDIAVGISTSGNSENVIEGLKKAQKQGMKTVGFLGRDGGKSKRIVDIAIIIPSSDTARIQEAHILLGHIICEIVEKKLFK